MFLSKAAITKQLFYEFLNFSDLGLAPGKPVELKPGTLLGSSSKEDVGLGIEFAARQLRAQLNIEEATSEDRERFNTLLTSLIQYKKAATGTKNPFVEYEHDDESASSPCAWLVFAPLIIDPRGTSLDFETETQFKHYLKNPKVGFHFDKKRAVDKTGLYIAVKTNNYEMIEAFLCPEFYAYQLTKEDLKKLLSLTKDIKTRIALFRHSKDLVNWIGEDAELQVDCVLSFEELAELWPILTGEQRKEFIKNTDSKLWLGLLDPELGKQKIEKLLGTDFSLLTSKLFQDPTIKNKDSLYKTMFFLSNKQQYPYLFGLRINELFPAPRGVEWNIFLSSLGYQLTEDGRFTINRYVLPEPVARVHHQLVRVLISLPIEPQVIIEALHKIETFVHDPKTKNDYQQFLITIATDVVNKEYETGFFIITWINKLLRYLKFKHASPLHPYFDRLAQVIKDEPLTIVPGEIMAILPADKDYVYKAALSAYFESKINIFWSSLPEKTRAKIVRDPIRFAALVRFLSTPTDHRAAFFNALDQESLTYFNTTQGVQQLVLDTPSFNVSVHLPMLLSAMEAYEIPFLADMRSVVDLLLDNNEEAFQQLYPFLPFKSSSIDDLLFQQSVLEALPKPLQKEHLTRFLNAYCTDPNHFATLLLMINNTNPLLVEQCWKLVPAVIWTKWYGPLEHAELWAPTLTHLEMDIRLDFFERLVSGGKLTADEFCDFLLEKNAAVFNTLWPKVPQPQWATWLQENPHLPSTTTSFLNTMAYPLRVEFFKAMLKMSPKEISSLCVVPNRTIEQFYPQEVAKITNTKSVSDAKAKLNTLKETKQREFNEGVHDLIKGLGELNGQFNELAKTNIKAHSGYGYYALSFFQTDPYYVVLRELGKIRASITPLCDKVAKHPLLAALKTQPDPIEGFDKLATHMQGMKNHLDSLRALSTAMPSDLDREFKALEQLFKKLEMIQPLTKKEEAALQSTVTSETTSAPLAMSK